MAAKLAVTNLAALLERDGQKVRPITFQGFPSLYKYFLWAPYQMDARDSSLLKDRQLVLLGTDREIVQQS